MTFDDLCAEYVKRYAVTTERAAEHLHAVQELFGWTEEDILRAATAYFNPPWPAPVLLKRALTESIEYENHNAEQALAFALMSEPPSERRDAILRELGYGKEDPTKVPPKKM